MQVDVPQILWHDRSARIMSIDFYPNSNYLVSGSVLSDEDSGIRVSNSVLANLVSFGRSYGKMLQKSKHQQL